MVLNTEKGIFPWEQKYLLWPEYAMGVTATKENHVSTIASINLWMGQHEYIHAEWDMRAGRMKYEHHKVKGDLPLDSWEVPCDKCNFVMGYGTVVEEVIRVMPLELAPLLLGSDVRYVRDSVLKRLAQADVPC